MRATPFHLEGKIAIVTGGNAGIGLGIATGLAQAGASLVIAGRRVAKNAEAVGELEQLGGKAIGVVTDVQDEVSVQAMVKATADTFGRVDILVNNAEINIRKAPQDYTLDEWQRVLQTNLTGVFLCARAVYPHMVKAGGGKIINIGSMTSIFGSSVAPAYSASKGGVVQLTKSLANFWAKDNIQVNAILPGWIHTGLTESTGQARYDAIRSRIPHGRWGEPQELAGTAVYLASAASDYVNGVALPVDGGYTSM
ncbi:MAG: 2-deoxy-D-gluconate 3-dehydrogenase [Candidatus Entotheonella gemina]|uniref:2-deoxy-D-gluconate 3-dehydrogenase n=1 Tax=Candidatus Entotheonella gemina TaxID=1429439 RepID=W4L9R0_9BACT|nr:MAG: 2-deoxy-D-gluconate 3-dehydrogenase [Candidatus Entotheonella gemina]